MNLRRTAKELGTTKAKLQYRIRSGQLKSEPRIRPGTMLVEEHTVLEREARESLRLKPQLEPLKGYVKQKDLVEQLAHIMPEEMPYWQKKGVLDVWLPKGRESGDIPFVQDTKSLGKPIYCHAEKARAFVLQQLSQTQRGFATAFDGPDRPVREPVAETEHVKVFGPDDHPEIDGQLVPVLSLSQRDLVLFLIAHGPVTKDELEHACGAHARRTFRELEEGHHLWNRNLRRGKPGRAKTQQTEKTGYQVL